MKQNMKTVLWLVVGMWIYHACDRALFGSNVEVRVHAQPMDQPAYRQSAALERIASALEKIERKIK